MMGTMSARARGRRLRRGIALFSGLLVAAIALAASGCGSSGHARAAQTTASVKLSAPQVSVPLVTGKVLEDAYRVLQAAGLGVGPAVIVRSSHPTGRMVGQFPAAGVTVRKGSLVR